jgi:uncharacterized protein (DUF952 family)
MIYHITLPADWLAAETTGELSPLSLETEGFIHCSDRRQVERSLNRFFSGIDEVLVLEIDPELLHAEVRYEGADNDSFPHIYGALNVDAVVAVMPVEGGGGGFAF